MWLKHTENPLITSTGVCTRQRGSGSQECDNNGYFKPRYCKTMNNSRRISCVCVYPTNGTKLTETNTTFADTGDEEANRERKPKCTSRGKIVKYFLRLTISLYFVQCIGLAGFPEMVEVT